MQKKLYVDALIVILISITGLVYTQQFPKLIDIGLYDESSYLKYGLDLFQIYPGAETGPLYALWYKFLSLVEETPVNLYFLNYRIMTTAPAVGLYFALRTLSVSRPYSIFLAFWLLVMPGNFLIWPKVAHFALTIIFLGVGISAIVKTRIKKSAVLVITFLLVSFIRPEYFISFSLFLLVFLHTAIKEFKNDKNNAKLILLVALISASAFHKYGVPISSGDRSMLAFGQHYSLNKFRSGLESSNPWTNWEETVKKDFRTSTSVLSAFQENPNAFLSHAVVNIKQIPLHFAATFFQTFPRSKYGEIQSLQVLLTGLGVTLFAWVTYIHSLRIRTARTLGEFGAGKFFYIHGDKLVTLVLILIPSLISSVVIFPRDHYLMLGGGAAVVVLMGILLRESSNFELNTKEIIILFLSFSLLIIRPITGSPNPEGQPNLETIKSIDSLNINSKVLLLEAEGGINIYLGNNFKRVAEYEKKKPWLNFLQEKNINMILVSDKLMADSRFTNDVDWYNFLENPGEYGFKVLGMPLPLNRKLFYKYDLIN